MIRTFVNIQDAVLGYLDEASDQDVTRTLVKQVINEALRLRLASRAWPHMLWDTAETITTIAGTRTYALHYLFSRPLYFYNRATNRYLVESTLRALPESDILYTGNTGSAETFLLSGFTPVEKQPTATGTVGIASSSAADSTSSQAVTVTGLTGGGLLVSESITPTGVTNAYSTNGFSKILGITLAGAWTGNLSLIDVNTTAILTLAPGELGRQYRQLYLGESPTGAETLEYRFFRQPLTLSADNAIPELPGDVVDILIWDTLLLMAGYIDDISPASLREWARQQERWENAIESLLREGQSLEAQVRFVRDTDDSYFSDNRRRLWASS